MPPTGGCSPLALPWRHPCEIPSSKNGGRVEKTGVTLICHHFILELKKWFILKMLGHFFGGEGIGFTWVLRSLSSGGYVSRDLNVAHNAVHRLNLWKLVNVKSKRSSSLLREWSIDQLSDRLIDWLNDWLVDWVIISTIVGVGGQIDFLRGAAICHDGKGKPILAMPSSTKKGQSKIVPFVKEGKLLEDFHIEH